MNSKLKILSEFRKKDKRGNSEIWANCLCECGNKKDIRRKDVLNGSTKSCGCISRKIVTERNFKHGLSKNRIYSIWQNMNSRCYNPKNNCYHSYGGRGISVCESWRSFENFLNDMGIPEKGLELDRINVNGNYCKENCRWITHKEQSYNRRTNVRYNYNGQYLTVQEISKISGIKRSTISNWKNKIKWSTERIEKELHLRSTAPILKPINDLPF